MASLSRFLKTLQGGAVLLMDGAMGTELQRAGMPEGACYELWNLTYPERVRAIHHAYVRAGAQCILTHTFQANPVALKRHHLAVESLPELTRAALANARDAAGPDRFVLGDIGPMGQGDSQGDYPFLLYREVVRCFAEADAILLETGSQWDVLAAAARTPEVLDEPLPVLVSLTYRREASGALRTLDGHSPEDFARAARSHGVAALGVNCGRDIGLDEVVAILGGYRRETDLPLFARPNAGTPHRVGGAWVYPLRPAQMAERLPELLAAGATMVGGCCGTTPEHIAALRAALSFASSPSGRAPAATPPA
jgi:5-methyltetrahydrofolate--homocysteine methyltransferase